MGDRHTKLLALRIAASLVMLAVLIPRIHLSSLVPAWSPSVGLWLVAAAVATAFGMFLAVVRWRTVLVGIDFGGDPADRASTDGPDGAADEPADTASEVDLRLRTLGRHYMAGLFVGNFLPSTIGGDVVRVRRLSAGNGLTAESFASVVLERLTGWVVLPFIILVSFAVNPGLRELGHASALATAVGLVTLMVLVGFLVAVGHPRLGGRLTGGAGWRSFAAAVHLGLDRLRHRPGAAIAMLTTAFAYQLAVVLVAFFAARALGLRAVGITACLAFFPAVAIVQVLPVTLGGLGAREWALVLFLHPLGVPTGRAVALGLVVYGLNLLVSFVGAPSFALGGPKRSTRELSGDRT
ncbi:MAG TPA: lysylphosphatidylglycerol synthase transmembrane domain-containing protein [Acidimicrobiales bacterium]